MSLTPRETIRFINLKQKSYFEDLSFIESFELKTLIKKIKQSKKPKTK